MKIISINIERDLHTDTVVPFLKKEAPDVVCMQELFEDQIDLYQKELQMNYIYKPMNLWDSSKRCKENKGFRKFGIAIFAKYIKESKAEYIVGREDDLKIHVSSTRVEDRNNVNSLVMWAKILINDREYNIANTHFTWTYEGLATDFQIEDAKKLINILDSNLDEFILAGDTNAPRGRATFDMIANKFKDNIPQEYETSLDQNLHRVKGLIYVVDCFFTKGDIKVKNVKLVDGVSDHMAVVGEVD